MDTKSLLQVIKASKDLSPREFNIAVEAELAKNIPFIHEIGKKIEACGINIDDLPEGGFEAEKFSEAVEHVEKSYSKRELAYLVTSRHDKTTDPVMAFMAMLRSH